MLAPSVVTPQNQYFPANAERMSVLWPLLSDHPEHHACPEHPDRTDLSDLPDHNDHLARWKALYTKMNVSHLTPPSPSPSSKNV